MKKALAVIQGIVYAYVAYVPLMLVIEYMTYRRIDTEKAFYALYYPLGAPFLLDPSEWRYVHPEEVFLNISGGVLLFTGVIYALRRQARSQ